MRNVKHLRRVGAVAAVAAVVALVAPTLAAGATYTGTLNGGGTLSFKTVNKDGKIANVKAFSWKGVPTTCNQGAYSYTDTLPFSMTVKNRAFAINATGGGVVRAVSGLFTDHRRKASGLLDVYGNLGAGHTNCATGQLSWSATRR
jgi:hypothetical protein